LCAVASLALFDLLLALSSLFSVSSLFASTQLGGARIWACGHRGAPHHGASHQRAQETLRKRYVTNDLNRNLLRSLSLSVRSIAHACS
jgi:hypothetical protein